MAGHPEIIEIKADENSKYYTKPDVPPIPHPAEVLERLQKEFPDKDMGELVKLADAEVAAEIERRKAENGPNKIEFLNEDGSVAKTLEMQ